MAESVTIALWPSTSMQAPVTGVRPWSPSERAVSSSAEEARYFWDPEAVTLCARFRSLVDRWRDETALLSSVTRMIAHPAYLQVIALGIRAVPLLLEEMKRQPDHWHWALAAITGEDPVEPRDRGDLDAVIGRWLAWGRRRSAPGA